MKDGQYTPTLLQGYTRKNAKIRDKEIHTIHTHTCRDMTELPLSFSFSFLSGAASVLGFGVRRNEVIVPVSPGRVNGWNGTSHKTFWCHSTKKGNYSQHPLTSWYKDRDSVHNTLWHDCTKTKMLFTMPSYRRMKEKKRERERGRERERERNNSQHILASQYIKWNTVQISWHYKHK